MSNNDDTTITIIRMRELIRKLGIKRSFIYEKMNPESPYYDATFPKPVRLGKAAMGWIESEVDRWILSQRVR